MPAYDPDALVRYAKMLEVRCDELADVIRRFVPYGGQNEIRKLVSFETAEFLYPPQEK